MVTEFTKEIRNIRISNNEILYDMANRLGMKCSELSSIENKKVPIPEDFIPRLAKEYNLSDQYQHKLYMLAEDSK